MNMTVARRSAITLAICFAVALIALSIIDRITREPIKDAREKRRLETISAVLPDGPFDENPIDSHRQHIASALGGSEPLGFYTAYQSGQPAAAVLELSTAQGYSGEIRMLLGLTYDGSIVALRVIEHQETPGLGDGIEVRKSSWIDQFESRSIAVSDTAAWQLSRYGGQFDGLTGATITSRAVVQAVHRALVWYDANRNKVFTEGGGS